MDKPQFDFTLNVTIKVLAIIVLLVGGITLVNTLLNVNRITSNGAAVSDAAKDDGKLLLEEVTESAVDAIRKRRQAREN